MIYRHRINRYLIVFLLALSSLTSFAQQAIINQSFKPTIGQEGKDVIWVPTPNELVSKMLEIAKVTSDDYLIDLGSGDGRTVIAAAKLGADALGIEYNPDMVELSQKNARDAGVSNKASFRQADLFETDLSKATVITMFLLPEINLKLRPLLLQLKPGTRIVSNTFTMGDWSPDFRVTTEENWNSWNTAILWIVPAKVDGKWKSGNDMLALRQEFQMFYGTIMSGEKNTLITEGRLEGDIITFKIDGASYTGKVTNNKIITGTLTDSKGTRDWNAIKIE